MCSPELIEGLCCICYGTLTPETIYTDSGGQKWDVHRGVCAILTGFWPEHLEDEVARRLQHIFSLEIGSDKHRRAIRDYHRWVHKVAEADYYDMSGPE